MSGINELSDFTDRGARALVLLHEREIAAFVSIWKEVKSGHVPMITSSDSDYQSWETLLYHVLRAARGYLTWICEKLELPTPELASPPDAGKIAEEVDGYVEVLFAKYRTSLKTVTDPQLGLVFKSRWQVEYCIDGMLEHAVTHPMRHRFQIEEWRERQKA